MRNKTQNKIIHVSDKHVIILLNTNETITIPIHELSFVPKVNDTVEVYRNQNQIVIYPLLQNNKKWIVIALISLLFLIIIGTTFFLFNNSNSSTEIIENHSSQQISSTTSSSSASSSSSSSTSTTSSNSTEDSIIDTTAEELRDMENTTQEIDTQAILHGDYSSIAGTWRNELGHEIVFNKNGLVKGGQIAQSGMGSDGHIGFSVSSGPIGAAMGIYPPGTSIPMKRFENNQMVSIEDPTDKSKTRIIITQTHPSDEKAVYYKID